MGKRVGRYRLEEPKVRRINGLLIVVRDRETAYVFIKDESYYVIFHRWYQGRGSYQRWNLFYRRIIKNKKLDISDCFRIAERNGICYKISTRKVEINGVVYNYEYKEKEEICS